MSNTASGGRIPTNEISNKNCGSDEGHKNNRNHRHPDRSIDWYSTENYKGKLEGLLTLGVKEDKHTDSFMVFQK